MARRLVLSAPLLVVLAGGGAAWAQPGETAVGPCIRGHSGVLRPGDPRGSGPQ